MSAMKLIHKMLVLCLRDVVCIIARVVRHISYCCQEDINIAGHHSHADENQKWELRTSRSHLFFFARKKKEPCTFFILLCSRMIVSIPFYPDDCLKFYPSGLNCLQTEVVMGDYFLPLRCKPKAAGFSDVTCAPNLGREMVNLQTEVVMGDHLHPRC